MRSIFTVATDGPGLYEFTAEARRFTRGRGDGLLTLFARHTSCSLLVQENADPTARADLETWLGRFVPPADHPSMSWLRHVLEGADDMPAHLKAAVLPVSLSIPVADGAPMLGTWQGIYLWEHRRRPHRREVAAHFA
ncbi:secondary thiamine-phosphate synthase enzyme YjbQ [Amaricoccus solimangrovi]|uniref:YjbQ family protein n=1 Tax=Amaricoccus solimangrovi TaxID=2589815 RepID=A0A501WEL6_9RHOB|nr:secondary thiamine-phosphate synthase enzyme YjbQ [Amaricoccus solimangrovi]TPE48283.1 YjbQ family protein [Amaricoccus solimangrovi]